MSCDRERSPAIRLLSLTCNGTAAFKTDTVSHFGPRLAQLPFNTVPSPELMQTRLQARPLKVALVAPSMGILGGQAVQADRLLRAWQGDPEIHAWLVPINPALDGPLRPTRSEEHTSELQSHL